MSRRDVIEIRDRGPVRRRRSATGWRRLVGAGVLVLACVSGAAWWWLGTSPDPMPRAADAPGPALAGVRLGESRDDLVFRKGLPLRQRGRALETADGVVVILDPADRVDAVVVDCARASGHELLAIRCGTPTERLEALLGPAERIATSADGARRTYAWGHRKVAFLAAQAKVSALILYADEGLAIPDAAMPAR